MPTGRTMQEPAASRSGGEETAKDQAVFERLFEFSPDAIALVDGEGRIRRINAQVEAMFGYARDELLGRPIEMLLPERFRERHLGHRSRFQGEPRLRPMGAGLELLGRRKDSSEFPVDIMLSPVRTEEGSLVLGVVRDVTERRRIEDALRDKNLQLESAMHARDRFLGSMSHELRTPLNAIIGFAGTLLMKLPGPLNADQDKQLQTIRTSARHLLSLINDMLDVVKIESGGFELRLEPVACELVVKEAAESLDPLAKAKGIAFAVDLPAQTREVRTDRRSLAQILLNLGTNAIKFTERGEVRIGLRQRDGVTEISVSDTGPGISEDDRARLFQAFGQLDAGPTRRHEGAGLGLFLSGKLAGMIGARIAVSSEVGRGSVFSLVLTET
jgi:PAS domain S-box-containing protein